MGRLVATLGDLVGMLGYLGWGQGLWALGTQVISGIGYWTLWSLLAGSPRALRSLLPLECVVGYIPCILHGFWCPRAGWGTYASLSLGGWGNCLRRHCFCLACTQILCVLVLCVTAVCAVQGAPEVWPSLYAGSPSLCDLGGPSPSVPGTLGPAELDGAL